MSTEHFTIVTGLSGSGKSTALAALEDAGYYCIDNLPVTLLLNFLDLNVSHFSKHSGIALGMDLRDPDFILKYPDVFKAAGDRGYRINILFLECADEIIRRRYSQTRRHHPLPVIRSIMDSIQKERMELGELKKMAHTIIDTSSMNVHELKSAIFRFIHAQKEIQTLAVHIMSFGFKNGTPGDADMIIDVRFLKNPYFIPGLKPLDGENQAVQQYVLEPEESQAFLEKYMDLLDYLLPLYEKEGKAYLTIAFGCTGGRHRSVTIARKIYDHLAGQKKIVALTHRDKGE